MNAREESDQREVLFQRVVEPYIESGLFRDLNDPRVNHLFWSMMTDIIADGWRKETVPEWEYTNSEILDDGTVAFGPAVPTIEEATLKRDSARSSYPWPEERGIGRRRKAGPWEGVPE